MLNILNQISNFFSHLPFRTHQAHTPSIQKEQEKITGELKDCYIKLLPDHLLIKEIFSHLPVKTLSTLCCVNHQWKVLASDASLWKHLLQEVSSDKVRNLDQLDLTAIGFPQTTTPFENPRKLLIAIESACRASENGSSTILTIPKNWTIEDLLELSSLALSKNKYLSVDIEISRELKKLLKQKPVQEEQTVVLTDTVIHASRGQSVESQRKCLKNSGFEDRLPDALTVLTILTVAKIITREGKLYTSVQNNLTRTRCSNKTDKGQHLLVNDSPSGAYVCIEDKHFGKANNNIGVGAQQNLIKV